MALVSVIIPTYKRPEYICEAIESVLHQTEIDIEIIVVDDNGLNTEEQLQNYKLLRKYIENQNIKYVPHKKNQNGSVARNTGIQNSKSDFIAFLDDDDYFEPNKIELQIKKIKESGADICLCGYTRRYMNGNELSVPKMSDITVPNVLMNRVDTCAGSCLLVKTNLVKRINGFDESFERQQDLEFLIRLLQNGTVTVVEESLVNIRMHKQNLEYPNLKKTIKQRVHFLESFRDIIENYPPSLSKKIYDAQYLEIVMVAIKNRVFKSAICWLLKTSHPLYMAFIVFKRMLAYVVHKLNRKIINISTGK